MALTEFLHRQANKQLNAFCAAAAKDQRKPRQLVFQIEGSQINLFEMAVSNSPPQRLERRPIAQLRYTDALGQWSLHYPNGRHWQLYLNAPPHLDLRRLLEAIRQDPMGFFSS